jgi:hypothetical protein
VVIHGLRNAEWRPLNKEGGRENREFGIGKWKRAAVTDSAGQPRSEASTLEAVTLRRRSDS